MLGFLSVQKDTCTHRRACTHACTRAPTSASSRGPYSSGSPAAPAAPARRCAGPSSSGCALSPTGRSDGEPSGAPVPHFLTWDGRSLGSVGIRRAEPPGTVQGQAGQFPGHCWGPLLAEDLGPQMLDSSPQGLLDPAPVVTPGACAWRCTRWTRSSWARGTSSLPCSWRGHTSITTSRSSEAQRESTLRCWSWRATHGGPGLVKSQGFVGTQGLWPQQLKVQKHPWEENPGAGHPRTQSLRSDLLETHLFLWNVPCLSLPQLGVWSTVPLDAGQASSY